MRVHIRQRKSFISVCMYSYILLLLNNIILYSIYNNLAWRRQTLIPRCDNLTQQMFALVFNNKKESVVLCRSSDGRTLTRTHTHTRHDRKQSAAVLDSTHSRSHTTPRSRRRIAATVSQFNRSVQTGRTRFAWTGAAQIVVPYRNKRLARTTPLHAPCTRLSMQPVYCLQLITD